MKKISTDYTTRMKDPTLTLYEKFYGRAEEDVKSALIHTMHELGVWKIDAAYSGGHDEGGVQDLNAFDKDGVRIALETDEPKLDRLWQCCDDVLSTKFFSWALGMSVEGVLYVDRKEKRLWTVGQHEDWVNDEHPIEWSL